ncbi:cysteine hydrolase family protein [uncultured Dubosiella sp.]|uniref:cysteine hydrolase family protein n=1 Tax=uncultured Dubosiella sp. TaxID=1937011 RepID=UPI00260503F3|nr:isochorismatase family cysteine hydrolase [uncultured Dubosiella sp.]
MKNTIQLNKPIVFVVDMTNGFVKEGALSDPAIAQIVPDIKRLIQRYDNLFICDAHTKDAREFQAYPAHCLKGSSESQVISELEKFAKDVIEKNSTNTFMAPAFQERLDALMETYRDLVITGCCTDLCVLQFALSLQSYLNQKDDHDHRVVVFEPCVDTYDVPQIHEKAFWNEWALANMEANGICVVKQVEE